MRIVYYIGEPGTGKTTLMRGILDEYRKVEQDELVEDGHVKYHRFANQKVIVLGIYDDSTFAGTDRWSKVVGPKFREWLIANRENYSDWTVLGEGERLSNAPNMDAMFDEESMKLVCLKVSEEELERRRAARNNTQDPKWMKGMRTRIVNLCRAYPHTVEVIG
jgi:deoxyadenosine/deoxycytidine kinase